MEKGHCGSEELELGKGIATTEQMLILHGTPGINAKGQQEQTEISGTGRVVVWKEH